MNTTTTNIFQNVPASIDPVKRYLFYLHGLIVEMAGIRPKSEEHGYYEYELILQTLVNEGFIVISEAREKDTQVQPYADKIVSQIKTLLAGGVAPENITVAGASKGGIITAYISCKLKNTAVNYLFLAGLFEKCLVDEELKLYGNVLSIHDRADKLAITPSHYFQRSEGQGRFEQIILDLDVGHGLIYQPYRQWIDPLLAWQKIK